MDSTCGRMRPSRLPSSCKWTCPRYDRPPPPTSSGMCSDQKPSSAERFRILSRSSLIPSYSPVSWISWRWASSTGRISRSMNWRSEERNSISSSGMFSRGTGYLLASRGERNLRFGRLSHGPVAHRPARDQQVAGGLIEAAGSLFGHRHDVLDPHAEPSFQVDPRFHGEAHAGFERLFVPLHEVR